MTVPLYNTAVFGAGPAGLSITNYLRRNGERVLLIDPNRSLSQPKGSPAGMVNPSAGRKANLGWCHQECYLALRKNLDWLCNEPGSQKLYRSDGVIRPAIDEDLAENFRSAFREQKWPEGWVSWLDPQEIRECIPGIASNHGGLFLHCGLTVYVKEYLHAYLGKLTKQGVEFLGDNVSYEAGESTYILKTDQKKIGRAEKMIVAAGADTLTFPEWNDLRLDPVKGELVIYRNQGPIPWNFGISALGYVLRRNSDLLIAGSTYERNFKDRKSSEEGARQIHKKFSRILPGLSEKVGKVDQLAGVRATTTNHLPVIGPHYQQERMFVFTGLGSKGLLFSEYLASLLGSAILHNTEIPEVVSSLRRGAMIY